MMRAVLMSEEREYEVAEVVVASVLRESHIRAKSLSKKTGWKQEAGYVER